MSAGVGFSIDGHRPTLSIRIPNEFAVHDFAIFPSIYRVSARHALSSAHEGPCGVICSGYLYDRRIAAHRRAQSASPGRCPNSSRSAVTDRRYSGSPAERLLLLFLSAGFFAVGFLLRPAGLLGLGFLLSARLLGQGSLAIPSFFLSFYGHSRPPPRGC